MLAPTQLLSASRQNLWRLTWIRLLVLAAQAGTLGFTYLSGVVSLGLVTTGCALGVIAEYVCVNRFAFARQLAGD